MMATASNPAIASPVRPPSAVSHNPMARTVSQQQSISRTGTPQMVQGTPVINSAMPNRNMTPTPSRMNQSSPSIPLQGQSSMMIQLPQSGQNMTQEQMQQMQNQQMQRLRMQQLQQQGVSPGNQQLQGLAIQKANIAYSIARSSSRPEHAGVSNAISSIVLSSATTTATKSAATATGNAKYISSGRYATKQHAPTARHDDS